MEIEFTTFLVIQISMVVLATIGILIGFFKEKLEGFLLCLIFAVTLFFGHLHLAEILKILNKIIPGFGSLIERIYSIDPSLVRSWSVFAEWMMYVVSTLAVWGMFIAFRFTGSSSNVVRGTRILRSEQMMKKLKKMGRSRIPLLIGQFFIPEKLASRSLALIGEPGTGKTQIIMRLIQSYMKRGEVVFCVDVGGDIYRKLGEKDDSIIAPTYKNSKQWSPFSEIENLADCKTLASMMIDKAKGESGSWDQKAIDYTADLLNYCKREGLTRNKNFMHFVRFATRAELEGALGGTSSMRLFDPGSEKMLSNIQSIVSQSLSFFDLLDSDAGDESFSFRQWARDRNENLWLVNDETSKEITLPLRRIGISLVIKECLSLGEDHSRRINVVLDELPANGRIASLQNAMAQGRKYGLNFQLGFQSLALMYSTYSRDETHAILGSAGHTVVLRTPDAETAEYYSKTIGDSVTEREQVSHSKSSNSVTTQTVRETQRAVMPTEIQSLNDLHGYIKFSGIGWSEIKIPVLKLQNHNDLTPKKFSDNPPVAKGGANVPERVFDHLDDI